MKGKIRAARGERGMTMVELLVAIAISALVLAGLMSLYWLGSRAYMREEEMAEAQYAARQAEEFISRDMRSCSSFTICDAAGNPVNPGSAGVRLELVIEENGRTAHVSYRLDSYNHNLYRSFIDGVSNNTLAVANGISSLAFQSPSLDLVDIYIRASCGNTEYVLTGGMKKRVD